MIKIVNFMLCILYHIILKKRERAEKKKPSTILKEENIAATGEKRICYIFKRKDEKQQKA